jgi:hypothetical protein
MDSLTYTYQNDIMYMLDKVNNPNDLLKVSSNEFPKLLQYVMNGEMSVESIVILNDIMNFIPMWQKEIYDDIVWPTWQRKIEKYRPFVHYDKEKFKNILKESLKEYA